MTFAIVLFILYVIPISIGILMLHWIIKKWGRPKLAKAVRKCAFILAGLAYVSLNIWNWVNTHHSMEVTVQDRYHLTLKAVEIESFLDWPIDFTLLVEDLKTDTEQTFEFYSEGPAYEIRVSDDAQIWFKGYGTSSLQEHLIDLNAQTIKSSIPSDTADFKMFAKIKYHFDLVKTSSTNTNQ